MSALSDALNEANVEGWSTREIARRCDYAVSHTQLGKYLKPNHPQPSEAVLAAFATVFHIPIQRLRDLAGLPMGESTPYVPPDEARLLNTRQRKAVDEIIMSMVTAEVAVPGYLMTVLDTLVPKELVQFLTGDGTMKERLEAIWHQRQQFVAQGGLEVWLTPKADSKMIRAAREAYDEFIFVRTPDELKGRRPNEVMDIFFEPNPAFPEAARHGQPSLRSASTAQDEAAEAPDREGHWEGA